jgi:hypothetical protein
MLSAGTPVAIEGCVDGGSWCDVTAGNNRVWMAGNFLQKDYQGRPVPQPLMLWQPPALESDKTSIPSDRCQQRCARAADESRHSGVSAAPPSQLSRPSNTAAKQHAVPTKAGSPENSPNHTKSTEHSPDVSKAATQPKAIEPKAKAIEPKTQPQEMAAKAAPEPEASKARPPGTQ